MCTCRSKELVMLVCNNCSKHIQERAMDIGSLVWSRYRWMRWILISILGFQRQQEQLQMRFAPSDRETFMLIVILSFPFLCLAINGIPWLARHTDLYLLSRERSAAKRTTLRLEMRSYPWSGASFSAQWLVHSECNERMDKLGDLIFTPGIACLCLFRAIGR